MDEIFQDADAQMLDDDIEERAPLRSASTDRIHRSLLEPPKLSGEEGKAGLVGRMFGSAPNRSPRASVDGQPGNGEPRNYRSLDQ